MKIVAFVLLLTSSLIASQNSSTRFELTGEYLFLMPEIPNTYFVAQNINGNGSLVNFVNNNFSFQSGYRVIGAYDFCDCKRNLELICTYFNLAQAKKISDDGLAAANGAVFFPDKFYDYLGNAESNIDTKYLSLDLWFDENIYSCSCADLHLNLGLEYANFNFRENNYYFAKETNEEYEMNYNYVCHSWGVGPEIGVNINYLICKLNGCLPGDVNLNISGSYGLLAGINNSFSKSTFEYMSRKRFWGPHCENSIRIFTSLKSSVGLLYVIKKYRYHSTIGIGYEFNSYLNSLSRIINFHSFNRGLLAMESWDYAFHGLRVSAGVNF